MESSTHWFPGRGRRAWMFLEPLYMLCGAGTWLWAQAFLSALTEGQGSGMCWNRRIALVSRTVMSTEQLGVLKWCPMTSVLLLPVAVSALCVCACLLAGCVPPGGRGSTSLSGRSSGCGSSRWFATERSSRRAAQHFSEMPRWAREVLV